MDEVREQPLAGATLAGAVYPWEADLLAMVERLTTLQRGLEAQLSLLHGLERQLARACPTRDVA